MKILRATNAGFCWGVERAINIAQKIAEEQKRSVMTDGPLIHNEQMMGQLKAQGIQEVGDFQSRSKLDLNKENQEDAHLVIRAHGISPQRRQYLKGLGVPIRDATCPDVGIIASRVRSHAKKGYQIVIFGDKTHPEVIGLMGYAPNCSHVVYSLEDVDALPPLGDKVCLVSQSTMFTDDFNQVSLQLQKQYKDLLIFDTICGATKDRQADIQTLCEQGAEAIVVIGGYHSANTKKLAALAKRRGLPTYHVETKAQIDLNEMKQYAVVGVTAGASTPGFIIDAVCSTLQAIDPAKGKA